MLPSSTRLKQIIIISLTLGAILAILFFLSDIGNIWNSKQLGRSSHRKATLQTSSLRHLCTENLLDARNQHDFTNWETHFEDGHLIRSDPSASPPSCRLLVYTPQLVVECIDHFMSNKNRQTIINSNSHLRSHRPLFNEDGLFNFSLNHRMMQLHFVGDSRTRQLFHNFLKLVPDSDRKTIPNPIPHNSGGEIQVTSDLLQVQISFKWQPLIDDEILTDIQQLLIDETRPDWILFGIQVHHMLDDDYNTSLPIYKKKVEQLAPLLEQLAGRQTKVIWLNQFPILNEFFNKEYSPDDVFAENVQMYNEGIRTIIKSHTNIRLWDSGNSFVEQYIRGCVMFNRQTIMDNFRLTTDHGWMNCEDRIHAGHVALAEAVQILLNDLCNAEFEKINKNDK